MNKGGRCIIRNGKKVQIEGPTSPPPDHGIHAEHVMAHANFLAMQAIDAIRALESRLEHLAPGITDDPDNVLPVAIRWKFENFPRVGLALLFRMMQTGHNDLIHLASEWKIHRDTIQRVRDVYRERYPHEPLRLALARQDAEELQARDLLEWIYRPPAN